MLLYPLTYHRFRTQGLHIGNITIGGSSDIVVQTMCNTPAGDVEAGYKQAKDVAKAGAQLIRFAVRNIPDAEALGQIKQLLINDNISTPIVADVHFSAPAAFVAARLVDKVRINPGNFVDKRATFTLKEYSQAEWETELMRIESTLTQLIGICNEHNTAIRIGVNHGSLSDRIMSRYGNTPEGMVESAMEFLRICSKNKFHNIVISLKSSNIHIMNSAYYLLVEQMKTEKMQYPLHLGVTEAGNDLSGRVKSAVGIGRLLADGIGDTIRISLTENPAKEIPAALKLIGHIKETTKHSVDNSSRDYNPIDFKQYNAHSVGHIGGNNRAITVCDISNYNQLNSKLMQKLGYIYDNTKWIPTSQAADAIFVNRIAIDVQLPDNISVIYDATKSCSPCSGAIPLYRHSEFIEQHGSLKDINKWVLLTHDNLKDSNTVKILQNAPKTVIVLDTLHPNGYADQRAAFLSLIKAGITNPVVVKRNYAVSDHEKYIIESSCALGSLFMAGMGNGIWLSNKSIEDIDPTRELMFEILQAARVRISRTDFIACPSCGRTQFDIEEVLANVRSQTCHLSHLKIAVMGCIVNGPGEMADADYGYVGAAPNKVTLYKGKVAVKKNISADNAVNQLINLIKENGDWVDA